MEKICKNCRFAGPVQKFMDTSVLAGRIRKRGDESFSCSFFVFSATRTRENEIVPVGLHVADNYWCDNWEQREEK